MFLPKRSQEDSSGMLNLEWAQRPPRSMGWFLSQRISPGQNEHGTKKLKIVNSKCLRLPVDFKE